MSRRGDGRNAAVAGAIAAGLAGATAIAARRRRLSVRGWLVANLVVPALFGRRGSGEDRLYRRIAEDRAAGLAAAPAKMRDRYAVSDGHIAGVRAFRIAPKAASPYLILYLHGGAYTFDLMRAHWALIKGMVDRTGAEVVAPLYPLAPEHDAVAGLAAVEAVYRELTDAAGAGNVVVMGDSAGGGLALALAHRLLEKRQPLPGALVLFFPWLDATLAGADQPGLEALDPMLSIVELRAAGRLWAGDADPADPRASPLFADQDGLPPTIVLVGTRDVLLSDARRFAERCPAATVREYPGMFHGWVCAPIPEAGRAMDEAAAFLASHLCGVSASRDGPGR